MNTTRTLVALSVGCLLAAAVPAHAEEDHARARELYQLCSQCHGARGQGNPLFLAPAIAGYEEWYVKSQLEKFRSGIRGTHPEDVGGLRMYPMSLTLIDDADIDALAAYVASMPPTNPEPTLEGGDPAKGEQYYAVCVACHGPEGKGNQTLNAPRLAGASDWYLASSLVKYKAGIRGGNSANANAVLMRGMSATLPDEQAVKDVVAYIQSLDH